MNAREHATEADRLYAQAGDSTHIDLQMLYLARAQVQATLAVAKHAQERDSCD